MQNITQAQKDYLWAGGPLGVTITVDPLDVTPFTVTEDDLVEGSLTIERNWALGNVIEVGCSDTSELIFSLDNSDGQWNTIRWEGARLTVVLDINGEPLQAGIFTVDERPGKLTTMQIKALDDMAKFNKPYDTDLAYPATLEQILVDACTKCNVTQHTLTFNNGAYTVTEKPVGDDITYHHIVAWVAELAGCNAWIDQLGRLQLGWYTDIQTELLEIGPNERYEYEMAEEDIEITGIVYRDEDTDYVVGTDRYALIIEENLLLQDNFEPVLSAIYTKIGGFRYRPYTFKVLASPHLWPGDVITKVTDAHGNELSSIIMKHMFKLADSSIAAVGETETVRGYATGAPFTASQKRVLQSVARVEVARQTSGLEQSMLDFNQLMSNALGYYETFDFLPSGARVRYVHDQPLLAESQYIWKYSAEGYGWTDQGWQDGEPVWEGIDVAGNIVGKTLSVIGVKAEWLDVDDLSAITGKFSQLTAGDQEGESGAVELGAGYIDISAFDSMAGTWRRADISTAGYRFEAQGIGSYRHVEMYAENSYSLLSMGYSSTPGSPEPKTTLWTGDIGSWSGGTSALFDGVYYNAGLECAYDFLFRAPKFVFGGNVDIKGELHQDVQSITVPASGWHRVAIVAPRSDFEVILNTTGGAVSPCSLRIIGHTGWGTSGVGDLVVISLANSLYWDAVRITYDGFLTFLEVNFTVAISGNFQSRLMPFTGYKQGTSVTALCTGELNAGSGTVLSQVTNIVRGINTSGSINAMK